jgi:ketosteroid isomerase-like protein
MKKLVYAILVGLGACQSPKGSVESLLETDKQFSLKCDQEGMAVAFIAYADSEVIKLNDGQFPVVGIQDLENSFSGINDTLFSLTWEPLKAEVAASGDLGYTFGSWQLITRSNSSDSSGVVKYGNYVSIWKFHKQFGWKYVLDAGTSTPTWYELP